MSGQLHDPVTLRPRKNLVLIEWDAEWAPDAVWTFCRREVSLVPAVIRTTDDRACTLDTIPTFNNIENGMAHVKKCITYKTCVSCLSAQAVDKDISYYLR
jgi:hypothetical protein